MDKDFTPEEFVRSAIAELRRDLLDFSMRNRLLSFKHPERGTGFVRAVDELPSEIFGRLSSGGMRFAPLPHLHDHPADEKTREFRDALEAARLADEQYQIEMVKCQESGDNPEDAYKIERALRERVRASLGMEPLLLRADKIDVAAFARANGINPDYHLPYPDGAIREKHNDKFIQTLIPPADFDRRVRKIYEAYQDHLQEKGINVLHAAFGFLEWYEDESSSVAHHAPLLLVPLTIARHVERGHTVHTLAAEGDEAAVNVTLQEFLKQKHQITLPPFVASSASDRPGDATSDEETELEPWLARVAEIIAPKRRWRVCRFVTIGTFPFSRIALYKDLATDGWVKDALVKHEIVGRLLGGRGISEGEAAGLACHDYPLDDPDFPAAIPSIILEADSSQHSAIIDAIEGKSFVIQGPPGTGKSQTIANIIAAALDSGGRILFMAEKSAALNVVASRLKDRGLGPFLFEVHSDKTRKSEVLSSLKQRLEDQSRRKPNDLERKLEQRRRLRDKLATYVALMSRPVGSLGRPLHQLMWFETRFAPELEPRLPPGGDKLKISGVAAIDQKLLEHCRELIDVFASARDRIITSQRSVVRHPWRGACETNRFLIEQIVDAARTLSGELDRLRSAVAKLKAEGLNLPESEPGLAGWIESAAKIPPLAGDPRLLSLAMQGQDFVANLADFIDRQLNATRRLCVLLKDMKLTTPEQLAGLLTQCHELGVQPSREALTEAYGRSQQFVRDLEEQAGELRRICDYFGISEVPSAADALALVDSVMLVLGTPLEVLEARTAAMQAASSVKLIANARTKAYELRAEEARLNKAFDVPRARREVPAEVLYRSADSLAGSNVLSFFQSDVRRANQIWRSLSRQPSNSDARARAADLKSIAEHILAVREFNEDARHQALFGEGFDGHHSNFDLYGNAANFLRAAAAAMASSTPAVHRAGRHKVIEESAENLKLLQRRVRPEVLEKLCVQLSRLEEGSETFETLLESARGRRARLETALALANDILLPNAALPASSEQDGEWSAAKELRLWHERLAQYERPDVRQLVGPALDNLISDPTPLREALATARSVESAGIISPMLAELQAAPDPYRYYGKVASAAASVAELLGSFRSAWDEFVQTAKLNPTAFLDQTRSGCEYDLALLTSRLSCALQDAGSLDDWMFYRSALDAVTASPCARIAEAYEPIDTAEPRLADVFELILVRTLIRQQLKSDGKDLADLTGSSLDDARSRFAALDKEILALEAERIAAEIAQRGAPYGNDQGPRSTWTERALIENEVRKRRRHIPIRDLIARSHGALRSLKPVWLMSPLTVAQYLPRLQGFFDLLIIDEASQMKPADAVGGLARARQAIIVGDPMQLPPTSFFDSSAGLADGAQGAAADQSSILDLADARLRQKRMLRWHYRSRHESLIAFSNKHFYDGRLVVFPSAATSPNLGIEHVYVGGKYLGGGTNPEEARAVVERACAFMNSSPDLSIGIATTNTDQRELILDELESAAEKNRLVADYRVRWQETLEPLFVKNLENVQGDERDIILISTVFGPGETGQVAQRFGPINSEAGHRRLNVLFTRAKRKLVLVTSLTAADVIPSANANRGVHVLKNFLEFSKTGKLISGDITGRDADSDFEIHVADRLRHHGYEVVPQVGVDGFRIDLGVKHSSYPHGFLAGIECDGATYHSGVTVRDRDRLRQEILEGLGWRLYRIWSTDWFTDQSREMRRLLGWLEALCQEAA